MIDQAMMRQMLNDIQTAHGAADLPEQEIATLYWSKIHPLAEAQYEPARAFFRSCLPDLRRAWRLSAIRALQHYGLSEDDDLAEQIRLMLWNDPHPDVRLTAAGMLDGVQGSPDWPDWALNAAMREDPIKGVRQGAFVSLLRTAGVPAMDAYRIGEEIREGDLPITWEALEQRLAQSGIDPIQGMR